MGSVKEFFEFCQTHGLNADKSMSVEAYRRDQRGLPWGEEQGGECLECGKGCVNINGARWYCFYCDSGGKLEGIASVELTPEQQAAERELRKEDQARKRERALTIWDQCVPITSSNATVATYLRARCLSLERLPDLDSVIRWHPACPFGSRNTEPCIVSLFRDVRSNEPTAIHRTHIISALCGKAERKAYGQYFGSAIKLWPLKKGETSLTVGEGIENVLSAITLEVGSPPAWAATVAGNLSRVPVIRGIKRLIIAADNDAHGKGQENANALRWKWQDQGREVTATMPEEVGKDFNDVLIEITRGRS